MSDCRTCAMVNQWRQCVLPAWHPCQYEPWPPPEGKEAHGIWQARGCHLRWLEDGRVERWTPDRVPYQEATIPVHRDPSSLRPARSYVRDEEGP